MYPTSTRTSKFLYYFQQRCLYQWNSVRLRNLPWTLIDRKLIEIFLNTLREEQERYSALFSYFVNGLVYYRGADDAHVYYPGALSIHCASVNAMEGFCRILPMISAWICSGRPSVIWGLDGQRIDLIEVVKAGLLAGTNAKSKGFWGPICDYDQRIVEAADIALSIWLLRDHLWSHLSFSEKEMISHWLQSVNGKTTYDNNWHLFPVLVNEVISSLGIGGDDNSALLHYSRLKSFYKGNGWFSDGPNGSYDYYNAWCIHYALFWINLINPHLDPDFIDRSLNDFVRSYKYFFSVDGFPITGRSICYRMAAPVPLIAAATKKMDSISSGMARRALNCIWNYFIEKGSVHHGYITQGYWQKDLRLLDNYSGPGSSMWSTRSLTLAFYNSPNSDFWTAPLENLPIEQGDYQMSIPEVEWEIRGHQCAREVEIIQNNKAEFFFERTVDTSLHHKFFISVLGLPYRSQDRRAVYELHKYSSFRPFWLKQ